MRLSLLMPIFSGLLVFGAGLALGEPPPSTPGYVGSNSCAGCHEAASNSWAGSHHAWAWKSPDETTVKGDFNDARIEHDGVESHFFRSGKDFIVETDSANGNPARFSIHSTVGIEPLQQYLLETGPGRLQALDLAWDTEKKRWYHLYPDQSLKAGNGLHWTGPYKTWNARCAECHATAYQKNYDVKERRYSSTQAEMGVGCEACHGPGQAHVAWARDNENYDPKEWPELTATGLTVGFTQHSAENEIQQCAGCHSRREPLADGNPLPGTPFQDAYRLSLLRPGLYHSDGSIHDEVYVYGSFLQSKMYARGVRCSNCHDPHAAKLKSEGNGVCMQCHSPVGNPRFPSLRKAIYDEPSHHFHPSGSEGAQCKNCHMTERIFMGVDGRRDHSFQIPRPDLSPQTGAPNACTNCHADQDSTWAAGVIAKWYPDSGHRHAHFSQVFSKARRDVASSSVELLAVAKNKSLAGIVRATALDLLINAATLEIAEACAELLADPAPLVRGAAVELQRAAPAQDKVVRLLPALEDKYQSVRIAAARVLLGAPVARLPARNNAALQNAHREWRASLLAKADFPEIHMVLGGAALVLRNPVAAERAFREAVQLDPQLVEAWRMIVRIRAAVGDSRGAAQAIEEALIVNPKSPLIQSLRNELN